MSSPLRRLFAFLVLPAVLAAAVLLFWADRSTGIGASLVMNFIDLGERFEDLTQTDFVDRQDVPGTIDQLGHAMFWGSAMICLGWVARYRIPVPLTALFVLGASMAFEFLQPVVSSGRALQPNDIVANSIGIFFGATALVIAIAFATLIGVAGSRPSRT